MGTNASDVVGSVQRTSLSSRFPERTSSNPSSAPGASERVNDGLRRSQSSNIALPPACDIRRARFAAIVDLPSLGYVDVMPIALVGLAVENRSILTLIVRNASANLENGVPTTPNRIPVRSICLEMRR